MPAAGRVPVADDDEHPRRQPLHQVAEQQRARRVDPLGVLDDEEHRSRRRPAGPARPTKAEETVSSRAPGAVRPARVARRGGPPRLVEQRRERVDDGLRCAVERRLGPRRSSAGPRPAVRRARRRGTAADEDRVALAGDALRPDPRRGGSCRSPPHRTRAPADGRHRADVLPRGIQPGDLRRRAHQWGPRPSPRRRRREAGGVRSRPARRPGADGAGPLGIAEQHGILPEDALAQAPAARGRGRARARRPAALGRRAYASSASAWRPDR